MICGGVCTILGGSLTTITLGGGARMYRGGGWTTLTRSLVDTRFACGGGNLGPGCGSGLACSYLPSDAWFTLIGGTDPRSCLKDCGLRNSNLCLLTSLLGNITSESLCWLWRNLSTLMTLGVPDMSSLLSPSDIISRAAIYGQFYQEICTRLRWKSEGW